MTALPERQVLVGMVGEAQRAGARLAAACSEVGLSVRTYERWVLDGAVRADARPATERPEPMHKLTQAAWREHLRRRPLILHADNGAAPTAYTLKAKLV